MADSSSGDADSDTGGAARMDDETLEFAVELLSALAHPTRLRIVELLTGDGMTVGEIGHRLVILQPNASQHLAILQRAGVVKMTRDGARRVYAIRGPRIARILTLVHEFRDVHLHALDSASLVTYTRQLPETL